MLKFKQYSEISEEFNILLEKLILFSKGKKYGQVVFLAGGAGSGKGFVSNNFLDSNNFKIRDVDEMKRLSIKISKIKNKFPEIRNLDLRNPNDVFKMHQFIKEKGFKEKSLDNLLKGMTPGRLPNIMFDITFKKLGDIKNTLPKLIEMGYNPNDVHLVWVLTDFYTAIKNNKSRSRVVPDDILLATHKGAKNSMLQIIRGNIPKNLNGSIHVVLNNKEETVFHVHPKTGEKLDGQKDKDGKTVKPLVVKSFTSIKFKDEGKPIKKDKEIQKQVFDWIEKNTPKDSLTHVDLS